MATNSGLNLMLTNCEMETNMTEELPKKKKKTRLRLSFDTHPMVSVNIKTQEELNLLVETCQKTFGKYNFKFKRKQFAQFRDFVRMRGAHWLKSDRSMAVRVQVPASEVDGFLTYMALVIK